MAESVGNVAASLSCKVIATRTQSRAIEMKIAPAASFSGAAAQTHAAPKLSTAARFSDDSQLGLTNGHVAIKRSAIQAGDAFPDVLGLKFECVACMSRDMEEPLPEEVKIT